MAFEVPKAPGMYPPEETGSHTQSGTISPNPYGGGDSEGPYMFYYEKDHAPPSSRISHPPGGTGRAQASTNKEGGWKKTKSSQEQTGPIPPLISSSWSKSLDEPPPRRETLTDSLSPVDPYGERGGHRPSSGPSQASSQPLPPVDPYGERGGHRPSSGPSQASSQPLPPVDPYEHSSPGSSSNRGRSNGFSSNKGGSIDSEDSGDPYESSSSGKHSIHNPGSSPNSGSSSGFVSPIDPYEHSSKEGSPVHPDIFPISKPSKKETTGEKGYRQETRDFKGEEELTLTAPIAKRTKEGKKHTVDVSEIDQELRKLQKLPVVVDSEEFYKPLTRTKPCCDCCETKAQEPLVSDRYVESSTSQPLVPGPPPPDPPLLNPNPVVQPGQSAFSPANLQSPAELPPFGGSQANPLVQSYFTPAVSTPVYGGGGGGCGCAPQICCQVVQPCCMPSLPCCPPLPPIPCCPQVSICCQPVVPCCITLPQITLPQICLPTIPLCFRGCPSCPCRRRRSIDDPRHHSRSKRHTCTRQVKRAKRQTGCRQCSNWNAITQAAGGCGTCNGSHKRVKRMGCLPCGRKKREALEEEEHIRRKRSCLPCLNGRKKREAPNGSCRKCSLLQTYLSRSKRSLSCGPCGGRKKRSTSSCSCAAGRKKREVSDFNEQCDSSCCDYSKCEKLRKRKSPRDLANLL